MQKQVPQGGNNNINKLQGLNTISCAGARSAKSTLQFYDRILTTIEHSLQMLVMVMQTERTI